MSFGGLISSPPSVPLSASLTPYSFAPPPNLYSTHVAGLACGHKYGVATNCTLCSVKVLNSAGFASLSGIISGINHVVNYCTNSTLNGDGKKCVINMSLGSNVNSDFNEAVASAVASGVVVVVAAGNSNADACSYSPASESSALSVGATNSSDMRTNFSNYGDCVDVYAPGDDIVSASKTSVSAVSTMRGTSMAAPREFGFSYPQYPLRVECFLSPIPYVLFFLFANFRRTNSYLSTLRTPPPPLLSLFFDHLQTSPGSPRRC